MSSRKSPQRPARAPSPTRPDARTFRRRRIVASLILLILLGAVVAGGIALKNLLFPSGPEPAQPAEEHATGPSEEELANPTGCAPEALELGVDLAADSLPAGQPASIPVKVRNTGDVPCLIEMGRESVTVNITSGNDPVWSSRHCGGGLAGERRLLLDVGASDTTVVSWPGTRSAQGCPDGQEEAAAGTYRLQVQVAAGDGSIDYEQVFGLH